MGDSSLGWLLPGLLLSGLPLSVLPGVRMEETITPSPCIVSGQTIPIQTHWQAPIKKLKLVWKLEWPSECLGLFIGLEEAEENHTDSKQAETRRAGNHTASNYGNFSLSRSSWPLTTKCKGKFLPQGPLSTRSSLWISYASLLGRLSLSSRSSPRTRHFFPQNLIRLTV